MEREVIVEKHIVETPGGGGEGTASNAIWAIAFVIIVALIAGAVYYSGILKRVPASSQKIDVKVTAPESAPAPAPAPAR